MSVWCTLIMKSTGTYICRYRRFIPAWCTPSPLLRPSTKYCGTCCPLRDFSISSSSELPSFVLSAKLNSSKGADGSNEAQRLRLMASSSRRFASSKALAGSFLSRPSPVSLNVFFVFFLPSASVVAAFLVAFSCSQSFYCFIC